MSTNDRSDVNDGVGDSQQPSRTRRTGIVTLTTDFGSSGSYVGQLKGVLLSSNTSCRIVDLSHEVPPQAVLVGALVLREAALLFPKGTVHLAVIDPGVGTDRRVVAVELEGHLFVLPDNGLLTLLLEEFQPTDVVSIDDSSLWRPSVAPTFHGRDIMAPVAALLAGGAELRDVGSALPGENLTKLHFSKARRIASGWEASIASVDGFGNVMTNVRAQQLGDWLALENQVLVETASGQTYRAEVVHTYGEVGPRRLVVLVGSSGFVELAVVNGSAAQMLGVDRGGRLLLRHE